MHSKNAQRNHIYIFVSFRMNLDAPMIEIFGFVSIDTEIHDAPFTNMD